MEKHFIFHFLIKGIVKDFLFNIVVNLIEAYEMKMKLISYISQK